MDQIDLFYSEYCFKIYFIFVVYLVVMILVSLIK